MKRQLFWKLCIVIALGSVLLFWLIARLAWQTEERMSFIDPEHQRTLKHYGAQAEALYQAGDHDALARWLETLQQQEQTWAAVVESEVRPLAGVLNERFHEGFSLGRDVAWKIHLYFPENPIMDLPFADGRTHFLIILPQRMRPGLYWHYVWLLLQFVVPLATLVGVCWLLYRHLMQPLGRLEQATRQFADGGYGVRVRSLLGSRNDELASLAGTFDAMAERTGQLIIDQRQRLADMSHELRTPLTRIEMAVSLAEQEPGNRRLLERIRGECGEMRRLVEDALTLGWLENERPELRDETLDLTALVDSILDDARFEFPDRRLVAELPGEAMLAGSSHRALGQAIENVVRNALDHTPPGGEVRVALAEAGDAYRLTVADQGPGVPEPWLERIFRPFFRASGERAGFGLGLALAERQVQATGGRILARNLDGGGLQLELRLPRA
ncbi:MULTISPECIES: sensor histidine kinase [unclassified Pseudomonas]|uniref:sensor histidine kinase n=1 Tax=unclassified Pseudomonas TaxID=196821 RepID=UPI00244B9764|nr:MULTISPECIES: sensor histidine kinase [unclassified Pseudomonas]MDG9927716.1 sensor histidine kinase [Pseudomonas sp. GD04042]MDH0483932.1 sensor histidine kinase [Pseudomonas sp. GD04015]MDH0603948.1 sensor histidine kinase [Pseudomonas sp. GD03869]